MCTCVAGAVHPATQGCADLQLAELRHSAGAALTLIEEEGVVRLCLRGACGARGLQLSEQLSMLMLEGVLNKLTHHPAQLWNNCRGPKTPERLVSVAFKFLSTTGWY